MALEKTVLSTEQIGELLAARYGLRLLEARPLTLGSANCFRLRCAEGEFFLKEYQRRFTAADVEREAALVAFLLGKGFPAARFLQTRDGQNHVSVCGHVLGVQAFIPGETYLNTLPRPLLTESAKHLGLIHRYLKGYPMESKQDEAWVREFTPKAHAEKCDALLALLEAHKSDPQYGRIRNDLLFKKSLGGALETMKPYYADVTYTPSHGDYTACQLICAGEKIKAVIDFSAAASLPAVWEVMRSFMQSSGACRGGAALSIEELLSYVREYVRVFPLSKKDLTAMPYVYLFQLSRSFYGYREYLGEYTADREELLDFAFWRTAVCREIYERADEIAGALGDL